MGDNVTSIYREFSIALAGCLASRNMGDNVTSIYRKFSIALEG